MNAEAQKILFAQITPNPSWPPLSFLGLKISRSTAILPILSIEVKPRRDPATTLIIQTGDQRRFATTSGPVRTRGPTTTTRKHAKGRDGCLSGPPPSTSANPALPNPLPTTHKRRHDEACPSSSGPVKWRDRLRSVRSADAPNSGCIHCKRPRGTRGPTTTTRKHTKGRDGCLSGPPPATSANTALPYPLPTTPQPTNTDTTKRVPPAPDL